MDRHRVDAEVEILPEPALRDLLLERSQRRRDEPHVDVDRAVGAEPLDLALLEDPQQLDLEASGRSPISSRNSVPPLAASKRPMRRWLAPVKAPFS